MAYLEHQDVRIACLGVKFPGALQHSVDCYALGEI